MITPGAGTRHRPHLVSPGRGRVPLTLRYSPAHRDTPIYTSIYTSIAPHHPHTTHTTQRSAFVTVISNIAAHTDAIVVVGS